jgi:hypothetical protein
MAGEEKGESVKETSEIGRGYWLHRYTILGKSTFFALLHAVYQTCVMP